MIRSRRTVVVLVLIAIAAVVAFTRWAATRQSALESADDAASSATAAGPSTVVVWISIDGVRSGYLERSDTPFLDRLMAEGAFSQALKPVF